MLSNFLLSKTMKHPIRCLGSEQYLQRQTSETEIIITDVVQVAKLFQCCLSTYSRRIMLHHFLMLECSIFKHLNFY